MTTHQTHSQRPTFESYLLWGVVLVVPVLSGCAPEVSSWEDLEVEGSFLMYRRQSLIGEETYTITSGHDSIVIKSLQGQNERGRISGVQAELRVKMDLSPTFSPPDRNHCFRQGHGDGRGNRHAGSGQGGGYRHFRSQPVAGHRQYQDSFGRHDQWGLLRE